MNAKTQQNRLSAAGLLTAKGELISKYVETLAQIKKGGKIRPKTWKRSGGHCNLVDKSELYITLLNALRLTFTKGNDAPKGGKEGDFIEVSRKECKKLI